MLLLLLLAIATDVAAAGAVAVAAAVADTGDGCSGSCYCCSDCCRRFAITAAVVVCGVCCFFCNC